MTVAIRKSINSFLSEGNPVFAAWLFIEVDGETKKAHHAGYASSLTNAEIMVDEEATRIRRVLEVVSEGEVTISPGVEINLDVD